MADSEQELLHKATKVIRLRKEITQYKAEKSKNKSDEDAFKAQSQARQAAAHKEYIRNVTDIRSRYTEEKAATEHEQDAAAKMYGRKQAGLQRMIEDKRKRIAQLVGAATHSAPPPTNHDPRSTAVLPPAVGNKNAIIQAPGEMERINEDIARWGGKKPEHIIPHPEFTKWIVLSCPICGANAGRGAKNTFRGIKGVVTHLRMTHKSAPAVVSKALSETLEFCNWRFLNGPEYRASCCDELALDYGDPAKQDMDSFQDGATVNDNNSDDGSKDENQVVSATGLSRLKETEAAGANLNMRHTKVTRDHPLPGQGEKAQGGNFSVCKTSATTRAPNQPPKVNDLPRMKKDENEKKGARGVQNKEIAHISAKPQETNVSTADRNASRFDKTPNAMRQELRRGHEFHLPRAAASARNIGETGEAGKIKPLREQIPTPAAVYASPVGAPNNEASKVPTASQEPASPRGYQRPARRNPPPVLPLSSTKPDDRWAPQDSAGLSRRQSDFTLPQAKKSTQHTTNPNLEAKTQPAQVQAPSNISSKTSRALASGIGARDSSVIMSDHDIVGTSKVPLKRHESPTASLPGEPADDSVGPLRSVTQQESLFVPPRLSEDGLVLHGADKIAPPFDQNVASAVPVKAADSASGPTLAPHKAAPDKASKDISKPLPEDFFSFSQATISPACKDERGFLAPTDRSSLLHNPPFTVPTAPMLPAGSATMTEFPAPLSHHWRHITKIGDEYFMCECKVCSANAHSNAAISGIQPFYGLVRLARHARDHHHISKTTMENLDEWCHRVPVSQKDAVLMREGRFLPKPRTFWKLGNNGTNLRSSQYRNRSPTHSRDGLAYRGSRSFKNEPSDANGNPFPRNQVAGQKHARDLNGARLSPPRKRQGSRP